MSEIVGVAAVSDRVLDELAEVLIDRLDEHLDRLTDRILAVWESEWNDRETATGRARTLERFRLRAELVRRACASLGMVDPNPP